MRTRADGRSPDRPAARLATAKRWSRSSSADPLRLCCKRDYRQTANTSLKKWRRERRKKKRGRGPPPGGRRFQGKNPSPNFPPPARGGLGGPPRGFGAQTPPPRRCFPANAPGVHLIITR